MPVSADDDPRRDDSGIRPDPEGRTERLLFELRCIEVSTRAALQTFDEPPDSPVQPEDGSG